MPKSHFPARGGPQPFAWNHSRPAPPGESGTSPGDIPSSGNASLHALEAENRRLRQELERARNSDTTGLTTVGANSRHMVWIACALCAAALIFALSTLYSR
jgi:hypothetical protein